MEKKCMWSVSTRTRKWQKKRRNPSKNRSQRTRWAWTLTNNVEEADLAILLLQPSSGAYFSATPGYLESGSVCQDKEVCNVDEEVVS